MRRGTHPNRPEVRYPDGHFSFVSDTDWTDFNVPRASRSRRFRPSASCDLYLDQILGSTFRSSHDACSAFSINFRSPSPSLMSWGSFARISSRLWAGVRSRRGVGVGGVNGKSFSLLRIRSGRVSWFGSLCEGQSSQNMRNGLTAIFLSTYTTKEVPHHRYH
jgi:hypothetical protein